MCFRSTFTIHKPNVTCNIFIHQMAFVSGIYITVKVGDIQAGNSSDGPIIALQCIERP